MSLPIVVLGLGLLFATLMFPIPMLFLWKWTLYIGGYLVLVFVVFMMRNEDRAKVSSYTPKSAEEARQIADWQAYLKQTHPELLKQTGMMGTPAQLYQSKP